MKYKFVVVTLIISIGVVISPLPVEAHILKTDGNIGAVLHISPDDDPIIGSQTGFFFEFKDTKNKFIPQNCDCVFSIWENGQQIFTQPLFTNNSDSSLSTASLFYTFAQKDVYQVKVAGKPLTAYAFQPFTLNYDIRVAKITNPTQVNSAASNPTHDFFTDHLWHGVLIILGLGIFIFAIFKNRFKNINTKPSDKDVN